MVNRTHVIFSANDRSYFAILKKEIHLLTSSADFNAKKIAEIDIIVAELVSNLVKHAVGGRLLVRLIEEDHLQGVEIISMDDGPGMADITRMVADGVSTKNTLGNGLGAIKRLSDTFQVFSQKEWGTLILARIFEEPRPLFRKPSRVEIKSVLLPKPGEQKCGDGFYQSIGTNYIKLFLGDGLGHGPEAEAAVTTAGEAFLEFRGTDPAEIIRFINSSVKKTRGLVGTVAVFDIRNKTWQICGVGNIISKISSHSGVRNYMAYNGIIGLNVPHTLNPQKIDYENGQHLIMCSDGLKSNWDAIKYPSVLRYDLSILSAALIKEFARNTDDISVVACKINL